MGKLNWVYKWNDDKLKKSRIVAVKWDSSESEHDCLRPINFTVMIFISILIKFFYIDIRDTIVLILYKLLYYRSTYNLFAEWNYLSLHSENSMYPNRREKYPIQTGFFFCLFVVLCEERKLLNLGWCLYLNFEGNEESIGVQRFLFSVIITFQPEVVEYEFWSNFLIFQ